MSHNRARLRESPGHTCARIRSSNCVFTTTCTCLIIRYTHVFEHVTASYWIILNFDHYALHVDSLKMCQKCMFEMCCNLIGHRIWFKNSWNCLNDICDDFKLFSNSSSSSSGNNLCLYESARVSTTSPVTTRKMWKHYLCTLCVCTLLPSDEKKTRRRRREPTFPEVLVFRGRRQGVSL